MISVYGGEAYDHFPKLDFNKISYSIAERLYSVLDQLKSC